MAEQDDASQQNAAVEDETLDGNTEQTQDDNQEQILDEDQTYDHDDGVVSKQELTIDLSTFEPSYNTRSSSALPHVLLEYGLLQPQKKKVRHRNVKISSERKKAKKEDEFMSDIDLDRQRIKAEHQMEVYEDVHRLRDYYYEEYMEALRDKIRRQREQINKKSATMESRLRKNELLKKEQSQRLKKRMTRKNISHDDSFLQGIPKSQFYKIVSLHDKWKSQGKLKTQTDVDAFWRNIKRPEVYRKHFGSESGESVTTLKSSLQYGFAGSTSSHQSVVPPFENLGARQLTQISESKETTSRPATREMPWMTTGLQSKSPSKVPVDPYVVAKQAAMALDKKCPQVPLPAMSCFTMELGEKPPDPDLLREEAENLAREKDRKKFVKTLRKMYNLSLAHAATTTRILQKHTEDFALALEGPEVNDLGVFDLSLMPAHDAEDETDYDNIETWRRYLRTKTNISPIQEIRSRQSSAPPATRSQSAQTHDPNSQPSSAKSRKSKKSAVSDKDTVIPLTLDSITRQDSVLEAKCVSTLWTNHMGMWKGPNREKDVVSTEA